MPADAWRALTALSVVVYHFPKSTVSHPAVLCFRVASIICYLIPMVRASSMMTGENCQPSWWAASAVVTSHNCLRWYLLLSVHNVDNPYGLGDTWVLMVRGGCVQRHLLCVDELWYAMYSAVSWVRGFRCMITVIPIIGVIHILHSLGVFFHDTFGSAKCGSLPHGPSPQCRIGALDGSMAQWLDVVGSPCQLLRPRGYTLCGGITTAACVVFFLCQ